MLRRALKWWKASRAWRSEHQNAWAGQDKADIETGLTPFQERDERALIAALRESGIELERRLLRGDDERFIEVAFQDGAWTTWIYEDGAGARSTDGAEVRLEKWDARTPDELVARFVEGVIAGLQGVRS